MPAHPPHRIQPRLIHMQALVHQVRAHVQMQHLAQHDLARAADRQRHVAPAFERRRGFEDTRALHHPAGHRGQSGLGQGVADLPLGGGSFAGAKVAHIAGVEAIGDPGDLQALGFAPARLGVRIDPASAAHTLFMLRGLSEAGQALSAEAARCFRADLPWSLGAIHAQLDAGLAADLLRGRNCEDLTLSADDLETLRRIVIGVRPVETAAGVLWRALLHIAADGVAATDALAPLLAWRLQCHSVASVCRRYAIQGGRALEQSLFGVLAALTGAGLVQG